MTHPFDSILVDGAAVAKAPFRAYEKSRNALIVNGQAEAGGMNLAGVFVIQDRTTGDVFILNPVSVDPASAEVIVSADGFRFHFFDALAAQTPGDIAATLASGGGLPNTGLAPGPNGTFKGTRDDEVQNLTGIDIVNAIDDTLGGGWKAGLDSVSGGGIVAGLPANKRPTYGSTSRIFLMSNGTIQATGAATSGVNGEPGGSAVNRPVTVAPAGPVIFAKVFMGQSSAYAIDTSGNAWSWGQNTYGALGHGDTINRFRPTPISYFVSNGLSVVDIILPPMGDDLDAYGALFLCSNGKLYYTGRNVQAEGGLGNTTQVNTPVEWASGALSGTIIGACFSDYPSSVYAWNSGGTGRVAGSNIVGQLGIGTTTAIAGNLSASIALSGITKIVATERGALVIASAQAHYAGQNTEGAGGQGNFTGNLTSWTAISSLGSTVANLEIGSSALPTCASISTTKRLKVWGYNGVGHLGMGNTTNLNVPTEPSGTWQGSVDKVAVVGQAAYAAIILQAGNELYAAGYNGTANLSIGATGNSTTFSRVQGIPAGAVILEWAAMGYSNTWGLVVRTDRGTFAGGYGGNGENGVGSTLNLHVLQQIDFPALAGPQGIGFTLSGAEVLSLGNLVIRNLVGNPSDEEARSKVKLITQGHIPDFQAYGYGTVGGGQFHGFMARGTEAAPTQVVANDVITGWGGRAWHSGGAYTGSSNAAMHVVAAEAHTNAARGAFLEFLTMQKGTATNLQRGAFADNGTFWVHDQSAGWDAKLDVQTKPFSDASIVVSGGPSSASISMAVVGYGIASQGFRGGGASGTPAAPGATAANQFLSYLGGLGHDGTNWVGGSKGLLAFKAAEVWTGAAQGTYATIEVTKAGTTTRKEAVRFTDKGWLGIGTPSPASLFEMVGEPANGTTQTIDEIADLKVTNYSGTQPNTGGVLHSLSARGTRAAPAAVQAGDMLGGYGGRGFDGTAFQGSSPASFHYVATVNWSPSDWGNHMRWFTTPRGTITRKRRMMVSDGGNLVVTGESALFNEALVAHTKPIVGVRALVVTSMDTDTESAGMGVVNFGTGTPGFRTANARGTVAAPTALQSGDFLGFLGGHGYDGSAWSAGTRALIGMQAAENWTGSAGGTFITLATTLNGTTTRAERVRVTDAGDVGIGVTAPTARLEVDGAVKVKSYTVAGVPSASAQGAGAMIYVSNETGGAVIAFSDGTNWRRVTDRAVIA